MGKHRLEDGDDAVTWGGPMLVRRDHGSPTAGADDDIAWPHGEQGGPQGTSGNTETG